MHAVANVMTRLVCVCLAYSEGLASCISDGSPNDAAPFRRARLNDDALKVLALLLREGSLPTAWQVTGGASAFPQRSCRGVFSGSCLPPLRKITVSPCEGIRRTPYHVLLQPRNAVASITEEDLISQMLDSTINNDFNALHIPDLKRLLKARGLKVSGNKADLIARLEEHDAKQNTPQDRTQEMVRTDSRRAASSTPDLDKTLRTLSQMRKPKTSEQLDRTKEIVRTDSQRAAASQGSWGQQNAPQAKPKVWDVTSLNRPRRAASPDNGVGDTLNSLLEQGKQKKRQTYTEYLQSQRKTSAPSPDAGVGDTLNSLLQQSKQEQPQTFTEFVQSQRERSAPLTTNGRRDLGRGGLRQIDRDLAKYDVSEKLGNAPVARFFDFDKQPGRSLDSLQERSRDLLSDLGAAASSSRLSKAKGVKQVRELDPASVVKIRMSSQTASILQTALHLEFDIPEQDESEKLNQELNEVRARELRGPRIATVPPVKLGNPQFKAVREALPAFEFRAEILKAIRDNQVIIIEGETGCGKTTQVGQFIMEDAAENGLPCSVVCTQPRRISAISVAERVADERGEMIGGAVGYSVRQDRRAGADTHLLFCTTGILLRRLESDANLEGTTHVVVDEVHERGIESDFLLLALRDLSRRRRDIKIILMSATIDQGLFSRYFGGAPGIVIPGRTFPVQDFFLEDALQVTNHVFNSNADWALDEKARSSSPSLNKDHVDARKIEEITPQVIERRYSEYGPQVQRSLKLMDQDAVNYDLIVSLLQGDTLDELASTRPSELREGAPERPDGVLVFLSGAREIETLQTALRNAVDFREEPARSWVLPLHGGLPPDEQKKVFKRPPPGVRKVVLTTNVAETSITIDDIGYVIDTCRMKEVRFDAIRKISSLEDTVVSRTNARQRRGRAGRVAPGVAVHVGLTRFRHDVKVDDHQPPEVRRVPLEQLVLRIHAIGLHLREGNGKAASICTQLLEPPDMFAVDKAVEELVRLGALEIGEFTGNEKLTALGTHLANLPVEARLGKLVLYGAAFGAAGTDAALTIAAALTSRSPFVSPLEERDKANDAKKRFAERMAEAPIGMSDHLAILEAYREWDSMPWNARYPWCHENFLSMRTLMYMSDTKRSLLQTLSEAGFVPEGIRAKQVERAAYNDDSDGILLTLARGEDVEPSPPALVAALLCAALFPQVVTATLPRVSEAKNAKAKKKQKEQVPKPKYSVKDARGGKPMDVKIHPSSVASDEKQLTSPFLVYQELAKTNPYVTYVRDVTPVPPLAIALFGGSLTVCPHTKTVHDDIVRVDGWLKLAVSPLLLEAILEIRRRLDLLFDSWVSERDQGYAMHNMMEEEGGAEFLSAVVELLSAQESVAPLVREKSEGEKQQELQQERAKQRKGMKNAKNTQPKHPVAELNEWSQKSGKEVTYPTKQVGSKWQVSVYVDGRPVTGAVAAAKAKKVAKADASKKALKIISS